MTSLQSSGLARRGDSAEPRQRILEAAVHLFADRGFDGVTLRSIGAAVGLHNSTLFHHFRNKREIASSAFECVLERLLPCLRSVEEDDPPCLDRFVSCAEELLDHFATHRDDARFLGRALLDQDTFLHDYVRSVDRGDTRHPLVRGFSIVWGWLDRARRTGAIRPVRVFPATRILIGILIFEPSYETPERAEHVAARKEEIAHFIRSALRPEVRAT